MRGRRARTQLVGAKSGLIAKLVAIAYGLDMRVINQLIVVLSERRLVPRLGADFARQARGCGWSLGR